MPQTSQPGSDGVVVVARLSHRSAGLLHPLPPVFFPDSRRTANGHKRVWGQIAEFSDVHHSRKETSVNWKFVSSRRGKQSTSQVNHSVPIAQPFRLVEARGVKQIDKQIYKRAYAETATNSLIRETILDAAKLFFSFKKAGFVRRAVGASTELAKRAVAQRDLSGPGSTYQTSIVVRGEKTKWADPSKSAVSNRPLCWSKSSGPTW